MVKRKYQKTATSNSNSKSIAKKKQKMGSHNSVVLRNGNPPLKIHFKGSSVFDNNADALAIACDQQLLINREIFNKLVSLSNLENVKNAMHSVREANGQLQPGEVAIMDLSFIANSYTYLLLVVEPDKSHIQIGYRNLLQKVHTLGISTVNTTGLGCGTLKVTPKTSASYLKAAIGEKLNANMLDKLVEISLCDRSPRVINEFEKIFAEGCDTESEVSCDNEGGDSVFSFVAEQNVNDDSCAICLIELNDGSNKVISISKCGHMFHDQCFQHFLSQASAKRCPTCQVFFGFPKGNMPLGSKMDDRISGESSIELEGGKGFIEIYYDIPGGIQGPEHLRPGVHFHGTRRIAYLPNTEHGHKVLKLLKKAFECRLTFTVGDSITTGQKNVVVWNNIHHKTSLSGGPTQFGFPDPDYLDRVTEELRNSGITEEMIN